MFVNGRFLKRYRNEKIVAITDSFSYKMISKNHREHLTFAFKTINYSMAKRMINSNLDHCIGAVGHKNFAIDLNRVMDINYKIPFGYGRERVHLTLREGDYAIIISRISNRPGIYDKRGKYKPLTNINDISFTMAKVVPTPKVSFEFETINVGGDVLVEQDI
ncbi:MAG: DUF1874 domain-containing protein [Methanobacterium paludis]|nr:DUF1874 domain-containing protein [Methanobacterium paludis]